MEENKMKHPDCKDWTAVKLSSNSNGIDPTKSGFKSEERAWSYAARWFCKNCRHRMAVALTWEHRYGITAHEANKAVYEVLEKLAKKDLSYNKPDGLDFDVDDIFGDSTGEACGCEWVVIPTEKAAMCEDFGDFIEAAGGKRIETFTASVKEKNKK